MTKELTARQKALHAAKRDFVRAAKHATLALRKDRDRLHNQIKKANARVDKVRADLVAKVEGLAKASRDETVKRVNAQIARLKKTRDAALKEAKALRADLALVRGDLTSATEHLAEALSTEKALSKVEAQMKAKRSKKRRTSAKKTTRKKPGTRKKARTKKVTKKRATAGSRKKPPARKKKAA